MARLLHISIGKVAAFIGYKKFRKIYYAVDNQNEHKKDFGRQAWQNYHVFTMYEKVKRVTIPMDGDGQDEILMISFDIESNHVQIILKKIIPLIKSSNMMQATS